MGQHPTLGLVHRLIGCSIPTSGLKNQKANMDLPLELSDFEFSHSLGRFPLFAVPGIELPVLASKQLLVRRDFQHCDGQVSARSGHSKFILALYSDPIFVTYTQNCDFFVERYFFK